jgi:hypothetical protein
MSVGIEKGSCRFTRNVTKPTAAAPATLCGCLF